MMAEAAGARGWVLVRGGGDLATGIALRLHRAGLSLIVAELGEPLAVRRTVSFSEAVYEESISVEGVTARRATADEVQSVDSDGEIPVLIDPDAAVLTDERSDFILVVDARMLKRAPDALPRRVPLHIGLGPGFHARRDCDAVIETRRGHALGRVYWSGAAQTDSGLPDGDARRVLRAPADGALSARARIAEHVEAGQVIGEIGGQAVLAPFAGVLRGLIRPGIVIARGTKIGDVDPRDDPAICQFVSDKSLAVGGGVLEALLSRPQLRTRLWSA